MLTRCCMERAEVPGFSADPRSNKSRTSKCLGLGPGGLNQCRPHSGKPNQYTGLQQKAGRARRVTRSVSTEPTSANRLSPACKGRPPKAPPEVKDICVFALFLITIGAHNCIRQGWLRSSSKMHLTCGENATVFMLMAFAQVHNKSFWRMYHV